MTKFNLDDELEEVFASGYNLPTKASYVDHVVEATEKANQQITANMVSNEECERRVLQAWARGSIETLEHVKEWADKTEVTYNDMMSARLAKLTKEGEA